MKSTILIVAACIGMVAIVDAQIVYEHFISPQDSVGDIEFRDNLITSFSDTGLVVSTGNYIFNQGSPGTYNKVIIDKRDYSGNGVYYYNYKATDALGNVYNITAHSIAEDTAGYIIVGEIGVNEYSEATVSGGTDIFIFSVDTSGVVQNSVRLDVGGGETAYSIEDKDGNGMDFLVCGISHKSGGYSNGVALEIDRTLNVNWINDIKLEANPGDNAEVTFYDLLSDGTNIWVVGTYNDSENSNIDGIVVKLDNSGNYSTSKRIDYNSHEEELLDVEDDESYLAITGKIKSSTSGNRVLVIQFEKSSEQVSRDLWLRMKDPTDTTGANMHDCIGYDIEIDNGDSKLYYIVGDAKNSAGSTSYGSLYKLDGLMKPIHQEYYSSEGNSSLYGTEVSSGYLSHVGYTETTTAKDKGYILKTDANGNSGCSDTVGVDTTAIDFEEYDLTESTDASYESVAIIMLRDTLLDSLICVDTLAGGAYKRALGLLENQNAGLSVYPNPVNKGMQVSILAKGEIQILNITVYNSTGAKVDERKNLKKGLVKINTKRLSSGLYFVLVSGKDENGNKLNKQYKLVVE